MTRLFFIICTFAGSVAWGNAPSVERMPDIGVKMPVQDASTVAEEPDAALSPAEQRIIEGLRLQALLHDTLGSVKDKDSADAAAAIIRRLTDEMQQWAQGFAALPPLDEDTRNHYEEKYLPAIRLMNARIKTQGERIASAEYYNSQTLPTELLKLVRTFR